ncbi:hypothetical protein [Sorangium sp. So ce1024]|uniref:hypothetical protein n=1 Tax=Sorangium sp. So ce1024 TaxID=3133327 RepID=UPI003F0F8D29
MAKLEAVVVKVVAELWAAHLAGGARYGIREVSIAVEEAMGCEVDVRDVHAAVRKTCTFWASDDPRCSDAARQYNFGFQPPGTTRVQDRLIWVLPRQ